MPSNAGTQREAINLYNVSVLKSTCDEQIESILSTQLNYKPSHKLIDTRLALGYASVVIAAITAFLDYKLGFFAAKSYITAGVAFYVVLNLAYSYWIAFVEKGIVFQGESTQGSKPKSISIITSAGSKESKYDPVYKVTVVVTPIGLGSKCTVTKTLQFNDYFATNGFIVYDKFAACIKSIVEETEAKKNA